MTCPRCQRESTPGKRMPGDAPVFCVLGPLGCPCGERLLPDPPRPAPKVLEKDVLRRAIAWMRLQPDCTVERINVFTHSEGTKQYRSANVGSADLHCTVRGRALFVEAKRPGGKQSDVQRKYQARVESKGCRYIVEDSPGLETLKAAVVELRAEHGRAG